MDENIPAQFSISGVLKGAASIYKNNVKTLLGLSVMSACITQLFELTRKILNLSEPTSGWMVMMGLGVMLISLYFSTKFSVAMTISALKGFYDNKISIRESYKCAAEYIWKVIRAYIKIVFIMIIPYMICVFGFTPIFPIQARIPLMLTGVILVIYLGAIYAFGPLIRIINPDTTAYLKMSS